MGEQGFRYSLHRMHFVLAVGRLDRDWKRVYQQGTFLSKILKGKRLLCMLETENLNHHWKMPGFLPNTLTLIR